MRRGGWLLLGLDVVGLLVESFSARLRDEIDLDSLTDHLIQVVRGPMEPVQVSLSLKAPEDAINRKGSPT